MPNRVIREDVLASERYLAMADHSYRLLFLELLLLADDFGLVPLGFAFLRKRTSVCEGKTEAQAVHMVEHLADHDLLRTYRSDGGSLFGFIPRFGNKPRARKPKWPLPPDTPAFKEINDLALSRSTYAPETETETETETDTTNVVPVGQGLLECPHAVLLDLWARVLPSMPRHKLSHWHETRQAHLRARWREKAVEKGWKSREDGLAYFKELFEYVGHSPFLTGKSAATGGRPPFQITLEWLVRPTNFAKVVEGNYHRGSALA